MDGVLLEAFRHNAWASEQLLKACADLDTSQLRSGVPGSYGDILSTFHHLVAAEAWYARALGAAPVPSVEQAADLDTLLTAVHDLGSVWERLLAPMVDSERVLLLDAGTYETHAGVVWTQALHHGTLHREQICSIMTSIGREPPDLQAWAYADATGRSRHLER